MKQAEANLKGYIVMNAIAEAEDLWMDTLYDEEETHKAGYRFAFASYGFGGCSKPDYTLKKFSDLIEAAKDAFNE